MQTTLDALAEFPRRLEAHFAAVPPELLRWAPPGWNGVPSERLTPIEQVWHLRDIEIDGYHVRFRRTLQELHPALPDLDGEALARERRYADRDPALWQWNAGTVTMGTDQLDVDDLVSLTNTKVSDYAKAPDGMRIGHMHLRVGDLEQADRFYGGAIGFDPTRKRSGAAFLSSGRYHHHLGINVWQSAGAGLRDDTATGLGWFSLEIAADEILQAKRCACGRRAHRPRRSRTASRHQIPGAPRCGSSESDAVSCGRALPSGA